MLSTCCIKWWQKKEITKSLFNTQLTLSIDSAGTFSSIMVTLLAEVLVRGIPMFPLRSRSRCLLSDSRFTILTVLISWGLSRGIIPEKENYIHIFNIITHIWRLVKGTDTVHISLGSKWEHSRFWHQRFPVN